MNCASLHPGPRGCKVPAQHPKGGFRGRHSVPFTRGWVRMGIGEWRRQGPSGPSPAMRRALCRQQSGQLRIQAVVSVPDHSEPVYG